MSRKRSYWDIVLNEDDVEPPKQIAPLDDPTVEDPLAIIQSPPRDNYSTTPVRELPTPKSFSEHPFEKPNSEILVLHSQPASTEMASNVPIADQNTQMVALTSTALSGLSTHQYRQSCAPAPVQVLQRRTWNPILPSAQYADPFMTANKGMQALTLLDRRRVAELLLEFSNSLHVTHQERQAFTSRSDAHTESEGRKPLSGAQSKAVLKATYDNIAHVSSAEPGAPEIENALLSEKETVLNTGKPPNENGDNALSSEETIQKESLIAKVRAKAPGISKKVKKDDHLESEPERETQSAKNEVNSEESIVVCQLQPSLDEIAQVDSRSSPTILPSHAQWRRLKHESKEEKKEREQN